MHGGWHVTRDCCTVMCIEGPVSRSLLRPTQPVRPILAFVEMYDVRGYLYHVGALVSPAQPVLAVVGSPGYASSSNNHLFFFNAKVQTDDNRSRQNVHP